MRETVLICGGGNGAHILTGLASSRDATVRVMSLYADEAARWQAMILEDDMHVIINDLDNTTRHLHSRPDFVTNDPERAVPGASIIFITVPAYCHELYLEAIGPYLQKDTVLVGLPSQMGFEFQCLDVLKEKFITVAILSAESLPWACRVNEFGRQATILGFKKSLACSVINPTEIPTQVVVSRVQSLLGAYPSLYLLGSYMAINLMAKSYVHPPIMFARWKDYDGAPLKEKPLFYKGVDSLAAGLLTRMSDEILRTASAIERVKPDSDMNRVTPLFENFIKFYADQIGDKTNLLTAFRSNKAYEGIFHPMTSVGGGYRPDFTYRFLTEDVPFGICIFRGVAEIVGVQTPAMDEVILWYQKLVGKEYLVAGRLQGKDLAETRAPQRYCLTTLEQLFSLEKHNQLI